MFIVVAQQKGGVGKTTTAANVGALLARRGARVLVVDTDPQFALTRQVGLKRRSPGVNLVDVLAGRAAAGAAIAADVWGLDVMPAARELAGIEMSLVAELGRELFLRDALQTVQEKYDHVVIDTPPNLGMLTVNALVCADVVLAPVSAEDEASLHGIREVRHTIGRLTERLALPQPALMSVLTRWQRHRLSSRSADRELAVAGLPPAGRIPSRSALVARAAERRVPLAIAEPDSSPALAYAVLTDLVVREVRPR
jgi:chromosome partitioning protein